MSFQLDLEGEVKKAFRDALPDLKAALIDAVRTALNDRLLNVPQAATIIGCSSGALRKKLERGAIPAVRHGRSIRVRLSDLLGLRGEA